jgi:hypothetical protein
MRASALGCQLSLQPAMRPPSVSAHIKKPKDRGSPAKCRYRKASPSDFSRSWCLNTWTSAHIMRRGHESELVERYGGILESIRI